MFETGVIIALWCLFGATHMVLSSRRLRARLVERLGTGPFLGLYSLVAIAVFVPLVWYYLDHRHAGPMLWLHAPHGIGMALYYVAMTIAFVLMASGLMTPSAASLGARVDEPRGVHWITRHALFMGTALWAALHLAVLGFASDIAFFGGFVVFAVVGCAHQDARKLADGDARYAAFVAATPFVPFTGRHTLRGLRELSIPAVLAGTAACIGARYLHGVLG